MKNSEIDERLLKPYDHNSIEQKTYKAWEESGFFNPDNLPDERKENFCIVLPPPNATGILHLGHCLELSIQDAIIRYQRLRGKKVLWLPGTDHAAIATEAKVVKLLEKEGKKKSDLSRGELLARIEEYTQNSRNFMAQQIRRMGASLDWSREAFTLDEKRKIAVNTAFEKLYNAGLIYRANRVINWDVKGQTVISDDEIVYEERTTKLYTFKYSKDFPIYISTTRPETKLGDTAVAVNPTDVRYKEYIGKIYDIDDFCGTKLKIKIVADEKIDKDFGTGAVGVTPAHSMIDWEIAQRHKLESRQVINEFGKMTAGNEEIFGKKTDQAREVVIEHLRNNNLLIKEEEITHNLSTSERTGTPIEPLPKLQYFIDVNKKIESHNNKTLKELMLEPILNKEIKIIPERFETAYLNWVNNLRDWCISRQISYGHRIPMLYHEMKCVPIPGRECEIVKCEEVIYGDKEKKCEFCDAKYIQDNDVLDTWFSSGLWTFSTLGWPEQTKDLKDFHPTDLINPGYEILYLWVGRMILMSQFLLNQIPFKAISLHGILRDKSGKKFSKSRGDNIDPITMIEKYGADALRMSLLVGIGTGNDSNFDENKVKGYRNFANKIWNIARFVLENCEVNKDFSKEPSFLSKTESKTELIVKEFKELVGDVTGNIECYNLHIASEKIYHYIWHRFADEIIEDSKKDEEIKKVLVYIFTNSLKILHPFMPFITEEIWQIFSKKTGNEKELLIVQKWPVVKA